MVTPEKKDDQIPDQLENSMSSQDYLSFFKAEESLPDLLKKSAAVDYMIGNGNRTVRQANMTQQLVTKMLKKNNAETLDEVLEAEEKLETHSQKIRKKSLENLFETLTFLHEKFD